MEPKGIKDDLHKNKKIRNTINLFLWCNNFFVEKQIVRRGLLVWSSVQWTSDEHFRPPPRELSSFTGNVPLLLPPLCCSSPLPSRQRHPHSHCATDTQAQCGKYSIIEQTINFNRLDNLCPKYMFPVSSYKGEWFEW